MVLGIPGRVKRAATRGTAHLASGVARDYRGLRCFSGTFERTTMPLLDHFHPPLSERRHWEAFHGGWANALAHQLNHGLLPPRYYAEPSINPGGPIKVDVSTLEEGAET